MTNTAKSLLLGLFGGSAVVITYLFRDEFTTDAAAPLTSPRAAEPGPGTLTINDTSNTLTISSGVITPTAQATGLRNPWLYNATGHSRAAGLLFLARFKHDASLGANAAHPVIAWVNSAATPNVNEAYGILASSSAAWQSLNGGSAPTLANTSALDTYYTTAIVLCATGFWAFADGVLIWVGVNGNEATLYPAIYARAAGRAFHVDYMRVRQLSIPFTADDGIATLNVASPTDATEYTGDADAIIDLTVTAPGSLDGAATTRCGFYYRADSDLSPAWHCYVDGTGAFNVDSIDAGGSRTNRITAAGVIAGGGTRTLRVICTASLHDAYSLSGTTWTKRGSQINVSLNNTVTMIEPSIPAGWSAANLRCYPRTASAYDELART